MSTRKGLSKEVTDSGRTYSYVGTVEYMPPEMVMSALGHNTNVDWWATGILLFELIVGMLVAHSL
jgi:serine/threonine protein kinase